MHTYAILLYLLHKALALLVELPSRPKRHFYLMVLALIALAWSACMFFGSLSMSRTAPLRSGDTFREAIDFFTSNPGIRLRAVVDEHNRPIGAVSRIRLLAKASGKFGRALFDNRRIDEFLEAKTYLVSARQRITDVYDEISAEDVTAAPEGYILVQGDGTYAGVIDGLVVLRALLSENSTLIGKLNCEVEERRNAENDARRLANTDMLTGLSNRRVFIEVVDEAISLGESAVLIFIDLDRFKYLNDKYGHGVGDDVLRTTAQRLTGWRRDGIVARLGGDEFAILIPRSELTDDLQCDVERLHSELCAPSVSKPGVVTVGASIGIATFPADAQTRADWLHAADKAMARVKLDNGGVNRFNPEVDLAHDKQSRLGEALHAAISASLFQPAFQPIADIATGEIVGHEVLARWNGPEIGFSPSPAEFIPMAERLGVIDEVFWCVASKAFKAYAASGLNLKLALNVSPIQCRNRYFSTRLDQLARRTGVPIQNIEVEITETAMFRDMSDTIAMLRELHDMGVSLALDDFGTGYSSLTLVKDLPLSKLKIDKSFVQSAATSLNARKIVAAAVGLSQALDIQCCAEGIENYGQLAHLREIGCNFGQGYLFGRPSQDMLATEALPLRAAS